MARITQSVAALLAVSSVMTLGCIFPTDKSGDLVVVAGDVPQLLVGDSVQLTAQVVDDQGAVVPNADVRFTSSASTVAIVTSGNYLLAVGAGQATISASAVGFDGAATAQRTATVRGLLEVDSILPTTVRFGDYLTLYGVGLDPDLIFAVEVGGERAEMAYYDEDPGDPRFGALSVWVRPPSDFRSAVSVLGVNGGVVSPQQITVLQRDLYEPNDTAYADVGDIPSGFANPGLAFERRGRNDFREATDWYRFTNTTTQDRTILVGGEGIGSETFEVFMADSMIPYGQYLGYYIGFEAWTIGPGLYACGGWIWQPLEEGTPLAVMALGNLPPGNFHLLSFYTPQPDPNGYEMYIANEYISVLNPDVTEENDWCNVAPPITDATSAGTLTIDNPHDIDWYRFSVPSGGRTVTVTVTAQDTTADLDLYVTTDSVPWQFAEVAWSLDIGQVEQMVVALPEGDYFLVVVDYPGRPTRYSMTATQAAPPVGGPAGVVQYQSESMLRARMLKAEASATRRGDSRPIGARR